jgi:hypothetical protein
VGSAPKCEQILSGQTRVTGARLLFEEMGASPLGVARLQA